MFAQRSYTQKIRTYLAQICKQEFSQKENNRIYNAEDMKETITVKAYKPFIFDQLRESEVDR